RGVRTPALVDGRAVDEADPPAAVDRDRTVLDMVEDRTDDRGDRVVSAIVDRRPLRRTVAAEPCRRGYVANAGRGKTGVRGKGSVFHHRSPRSWPLGSLWNPVSTRTRFQ